MKTTNGFCLLPSRRGCSPHRHSSYLTASSKSLKLAIIVLDIDDISRQFGS